MENTSSPSFDDRIGFHYYPDTDHYRQIDLDTWLPELAALGARRLVLIAPPSRAVPERFIAGLIEAGIRPVLHFGFDCASSLPRANLRLLLHSYACWGVGEVVFFDRPNLRQSWPAPAWLQGDLVERFLDLFLPAAELAVEAGLTPFFPPLVPGGDYWDLSFLHTVLRGLKRRNAERVLDRLGLCAEASIGVHPVDWGAGGPGRWPAARPYFTPPGGQDHRGFRIFDWYLDACRRELGRELPVLLVRAGQVSTGTTLQDLDAAAAGASPDPDAEAPQPLGPVLAARVNHARQNQEIAVRLALPPDSPGAVPAAVVGCCFQRLTAAQGDPVGVEAWFPPAASPLPAVGALRRWVAWKRSGGEAFEPLETVEDLKPQLPPDDSRAAAPADSASQPPVAYPVDSPAVPPVDEPTAGQSGEDREDPGPDQLIEEDQLAPAAAAGEDLLEPEAAGEIQPASEGAAPELLGDSEPVEAALPDSGAAQPGSSSISHYILLPLYAWGAADWDLSLIQPILSRGAHPTIGFSLAEARLAHRVTVVGGPGAVSAEALAMLRRSGCQVVRLLEDGTQIAT